MYGVEGRHAMRSEGVETLRRTNPNFEIFYDVDGALWTVHACGQKNGQTA